MIDQDNSEEELQYLFNQYQQKVANKQQGNKDDMKADNEINMKSDYSRINMSQQSLLDQIKQKIQIKKPNFNIVSIPYITMHFQYNQDQPDALEYFCASQLGIQVFDTEQMIDKFLIVEPVKFNHNFEIDEYQELIDKYKNFNTQKISELEKIRQIQSEYDVIWYNIYTIELENQTQFLVYEIEQIDLPYENFIYNLDQESKNILQESVNKLNQILSWRYEKKINSLQNYYIKITDRHNIQIKSLQNVMKCIKSTYSYPLDDYSDYACVNSFFSDEQTKKILKSKELNLKPQLRKYLDLIQQKIRIQKQNLLKAIDILAPELTKYHNEILLIIQQHPRYQFISLIDFNQDQIFFKIYDNNKKYFLKIEKFESQKDANKSKKYYESLRQFQLENKGIFLDVGECEIICIESFWYVLFEEKLIQKQKNHKLIPIKQIDRIQQTFQNLNCPQEYILLYLIIRSLYHFQKIYQYGFKNFKKFECQPYIYISDMNKISLSSITFNMSLVTYKTFENLFFEKNMLIEMCNSFISENLKNINYKLIYNFKLQLQNYIKYQEKNNVFYTLDQLHNKFPLFNYFVKQIEQYISLYEQFSSLKSDTLYLNKNFKIIQKVNLSDLIERKDILNTVMQIEFQSFACSFEQLSKCQRYLNKNNNIQHLKIGDSNNDLEKEFNKIENKNDIHEKEELKNNKSFFNRVQKVSIKSISTIFMDQQINSQQFPSLEEINIKVRFEYQQQKIQMFERINQIKNLLQIFENVKTFKIINIHINDFLFPKTNYDYENFNYFNHPHRIKDKKEYYIGIYNNNEIEQKYNNYKEVMSSVLETIDNFVVKINIQNDYFSLKTKKQILEILLKFKYIQCESLIQTIENDGQVDNILLLQFKDTSEFNLGEIEISLKVQVADEIMIGYNILSIQSFKCRNQLRMNDDDYQLYDFRLSQLENLIVKWIVNQMEAYFLTYLLGTVPECKCNDFYNIALQIYKGQKFIKSITLNIPQNNCSQFCLNKFYDQLGLSEGNQFIVLQELVLNFAEPNNLNQIDKDLFKIINKNESINTLTTNCEISSNMLKLKRIVRLNKYE